MQKLLWFLLVLLAAANICAPIGDPDLWWHITVGDWILKHNRVPMTDHWNMFSAGAPWRAYSWSSEIVYAAVDAQFGIFGLLVLKLALALMLCSAICFMCTRLAHDPIFGLAFGLIASTICYAHFGLRPQLYHGRYLL